MDENRIEDLIEKHKNVKSLYQQLFKEEEALEKARNEIREVLGIFSRETKTDIDDNNKSCSKTPNLDPIATAIIHISRSREKVANHMLADCSSRSTAKVQILKELEEATKSLLEFSGQQVSNPLYRG